MSTPHWPDERPRDPEDLRPEVLRELRAEAAAQPRWRKWSNALGHRGAFLVTVGILYFALGYGYAMGQTPPEVIAQLAMPIRVMDFLFGVSDPQTAITIWAILWMTSAVIAMITSWWPAGYDFVGFIALWSFACLWSLLNFGGALFLDAPRAHVVGFIFFVHAISVLIVSAMVDPSAVSRIVDREA